MDANSDHGQTTLPLIDILKGITKNSYSPGDIAISHEGVKVEILEGKVRFTYPDKTTQLYILSSDQGSEISN